MARALGRYELLRPLARGGMAEVYLARRRSAGIEKWLVVKRMRPETTGDPQFLDLFVREARLSMSLAHQNIVPVFDFGKIDDQVFLAMERVEGKDLGSSLARAPGHRLPSLLAAFIAAECCQALDYAHQRKSPDGVALGIVHRDVTPRNVLLSWSGEVKLTDFGIAALAGDATVRLLGTPLYMAPEQARSEPTDPRADLYAIGLVMREAITGSRSRPGTDRETILDAARRAELVPWPPDDPPPAALIAIVDRATAALPGDRYPDARSMLEELDSFIVGQRAAHKAESPARQVAAWLAAVWDGARDDAETDAAIHADHLVSFLDDGELDVIGTGTVRSLALTAADDVPPAAPADPAALPAAPAGAAALPAAPELPAPGLRRPTTGSRPVVPAVPAPGSPARATENPVRASRISSSNMTVASGSFHTLSERGGRGRRSTASGLTASARRWRLISLASVALAAGAAGVLVVGSLRSEPPPTGQPPTGQPPTGQPPTGQPPTGQPPTGQPPTGQPPTGQLPTGQPSGQSATVPPAAGPPSTGFHATAPRPPPGRGGGRAATGRPSGGHPGPPARSESTPPIGAGDLVVSEPADAPRPALCRVRINLTPWAYYTADEDPARHETPGTIDLAPGLHRLHVWNPELHVERDIALSVPADRNTMNYTEPLQPSTLPARSGSAR